MSVSTHALVIQSPELKSMKNSPKLNMWKSSYLSRSKKLLGEDPKIYFKRTQSANLSTVFHHLNNKFKADIRTQKRKNASDIEAFLSPMLKMSNQEYGYSQFVLETALACQNFKQGSSFKTQLCQSLPKVYYSVLRMIKENLPHWGERYVNYTAYSKGSVDSGRGLVLVRALTPLYMARKINSNTINGTQWPNNIKRYAQSFYNDFDNEISHSLRDFYIKIIMMYKPEGKNTRNFYYQISNEYREDTAVDVCDKYRKAAKSSTPRCTSNHSMVAFLGKLMIRSLKTGNVSRDRAKQLLAKNYGHFKKLIDKGIFSKAGEMIPSDRYRTSIKKKNVRERRGIAYTLLQLRSLTLAAEILGRHTSFSYNLYEFRSQKLLKAIHFLAKVSSKKKNISDIYFSDDRYVGDRFFHEDEFSKYIYTRDHNKKNAHARRFGFFLAPKKRFCRSSRYQVNYPYLCIGENYNRTQIIRNIIPIRTSRYSDSIEGLNIGPAQLLFSEI